MRHGPVVVWAFRRSNISMWFSHTQQVEDSWLVANLKLIDVPEQLEDESLKRTECAGLRWMVATINGELNSRDFARTGWLSEQTLLLLIQACEGPNGSPSEREGFRGDLEKALTMLREDAATAGIEFSPDFEDE